MRRITPLLTLFAALAAHAASSPVPTSASASALDAEARQFFKPAVPTQDSQLLAKGAIGNPTASGKSGAIDRNNPNAGGTFNTAQQGTYPCLGTTQTFAVGGWTGTFACAKEGTVDLRMCPVTPGMGTCTTEEQYKTYKLTNGVKVTDDAIGLALTADFKEGFVTFTFGTRVVVPTVTAPPETVSTGGTGGGSGAAGGGTAPLATSKMLKDVNNSTAYKDALATVAQDFRACQGQAIQGQDCAGNSVITPDEAKAFVPEEARPTEPTACEDVCLDKQSVKTEWAETCTRSFTRTSYGCAFTREPVTCKTDVAKTVGLTYTCEKSKCSAVTAAMVEEYYGGVDNCVRDASKDACYNSGFSQKCDQTWNCTMGAGKRTCDGPEPKEKDGFVQVKTSTTEVACSGGTCKQLTEIWLGPEKATLSCTASPLPLFGTPSSSCENGGAGTTRGACEAWYGRTLTTAACTVQGSSTMDLDESMKEGCGYCLRYQKFDTCLALAATTDEACPAATKSACSLTSSTCVSGSPFGSNPLCYAQEERYSCATESNECKAWGKSPECAPPAQGAATLIPSPRAKPGGAAMTQALVGLALLDASTKSVVDCAGGMGINCTALGAGNGGIAASDTKAEGEPELSATDLAWLEANGGLSKVFNGALQECEHKIVNGVPVNCCNLALAEPGANCSESDVKLVKARKNKFTHYLGEYCKESVAGSCLTTAEAYCTFDGLLPRVVHEQGRRQIEGSQGIYTGNDTKTFQLSFPYYNTGDAGSWVKHETSGNVHIYAWNWPSWCSDVTTAIQKLNADLTRPACPSVPEVWFTACVESTDPAAPRRCDVPPATPFDKKPFFSTTSANPLATGITSVHRQALVSGSCDSASTLCNYKASLSESGNRLTLSREVSFRSTTGVSPEAGEPTQQANSLIAIGNTYIRAVTLAQEGAGPEALPIQYSTDGGTTWSITAITPSMAPTRLPSAENVDITIGCDSVGENMPRECVIKASGNVVLTNKPWGTPPGTVDCSGFTPAQFTALDLERMDLSEWTSTLSFSTTLDREQMAATINQNVQDLTSQRLAGVAMPMTTGGVSSAPEQAQTAWVSPSTGFGPFDVKLVVAGNYPQNHADPALNTNPVSSVLVDWGDCSAQEAAVPQMVGGGAQNFTAVHSFQKPTAINCVAGSPARQIGGAQNIRHAVTLRITAKDGVHTVVKEVINNHERVDPAMTPSQNTTTAGRTFLPAVPQPSIPGAGSY